MAVSKMIVIISLIVLIISNANSQKCSSTSIDEEDFNDQLFVNTFEIEPKHKGLVVEFLMENTLTIDATGSSTKYLTVEFDDQKLKISTTSEFMNYELNEIDVLMTIEINFVCVEGTRRLNFYQNIKVVNNYAPLFSKTSYEIKIPTPLPKGLDLTIFMMDEVISAIDYDLKFYQLEFSVSDTTLFSVESRTDGMSKKYTGIITTNQQITKLTSPVTFTITAIDSFEGNRKSSSVTVKVFSDPEVLNIDPPSFKKALYRGMVMEDGSFEMETITPTYVEDVEFVLEGDYAEYFSIQQNDAYEIKLSIEKPLEVAVLKLHFLSFSVVARKEANSDGIATILIEIDSNEQKAPLFEKVFYEGLIVEKDESFLMEEIVLSVGTYAKDVEFKYSGKDLEYFKLSQIDNKIKVQLSEAFNIGDVKGVSDLMFEIEATKPDHVAARTVVLVRISQFVIVKPKFEKSIYIGHKPDIGVLSLENIVISKETFDKSIDISLQGEDANLFEIKEQNENVIQVGLKSAVLETEKEFLQLVVEATLIGLEVKEFANIFISVGQKNPATKALSFSKSIYEGSVTKDMKLIVEKVKLNEDNLDDDVEIQLSGRNQQLFTFTRTTSEVLLTLKEGVTLDQLPNIPTLLVSVDAFSDKFRSASTNVVVTIVLESDETKALSFSKSIYEGYVTKDMKLIVEKVKLNEDNLDDDVEIQLSGRNQQLFTFTRTTSEVLLTLKEGVTLDQLPNIPTLLVSVDAFSDKFRSASTNVVVSVSTEMNSNLKFQKSLYIGSVNNLKELLLENLLIESNNNINFHIEISGDDKDLFSIDMIDNSITVSLQKDITEDLWNSRVILILNITASFNGMQIETIVVITLPKKSEDKLLLFEKPSYIGSIDLNTVLDLEVIVLELNNYDSLVTFEFSGMNSELFVMQVDNNSVSLQLKEGITIRDFVNIVLITLEIKAKRDNLFTGMTIVFLQLPWKVEQVDFLAFDKVSYRGKFNIDKVLLLDTIKLNPTTFSADVIVSLKGDDAGSFSLAQKSNEIELIMKQLTNLENRSIFNLYVEAVKFGAPKVYANVVIDVEKMKKLTFDSLIYIGKLNADYTLNFEVTSVSGDMSDEDVSFVLKDNDDIDLFEVKRQGNDLIIVNSTRITDDNLANKLFFSFYLEASKDKFYSAMSLIIIEIPETNSSVPIEDCIDKSDPSQPFFQTGAYSFVFQSDTKGSFGRIRAMIVDSKMGRIEYKLQTQDDYLSLRVSVNAESGHLVLSKELAVGLYTVTAVAINTDNNKVAYTRISITVERARICTEHVLTTVQKTLAIEVLSENIVHSTILPTVIGNCELEILSVNPSALRELFAIDKITHFLTSLKFDREDAVFVNQTVPQIQLKLNLNCANAIVGFQNYSEIQEQRLILTDDILILTDDILFSTNSMILNIVIEDQNDNFPVFTHPPTKSFLVGYPEQKLADKLLPPNLMIVEAFDVDEGLNAKIKYTLNDNRHFAIDHEAGIIYPLTECMFNTDEVNLIVTATDRNGALDGNAEIFNLKVKKVTKDNLVVLTTENEQLSDVELFLRNITVITKMNLLSINYAAIPNDGNKQEGKQLLSYKTQLTMNDVDTFIKIFVYAFDAESELKTSDEILEILKISDIAGTSNFKAFVDDVPDCNVTGFIIAVSILGGLLITVCAAVPLLWFLWLYPKFVSSRRKESESSVQQFDADFNNSLANTSPVLPMKTNTVSDEDILGIQIDGATSDENPNVLSRLEDALGLILDGSEVPSPTDSISSEKKRSNVRFNELVERIEVLAEVDDVKVDEEELNERL